MSQLKKRVLNAAGFHAEKTEWEGFCNARLVRGDDKPPTAFRKGAGHENARLLPLIIAMADELDRVREIVSEISAPDDQGSNWEEQRKQDIFFADEILFRLTAFSASLQPKDSK